MIENLGLFPLNSVINAGISDFISLFRNGSTAYNGGNEGKVRKYTSTRGILIPEKMWVKTSSILDYGKLKKEGFIFQFNPESIQDSKSTYWADREYTGLGFTDAIWSRGGSRHISFNLFIDDTIQSGTDEFRPEEYGFEKSNGLVTSKLAATTRDAMPITDRIQTLRELKSYGKTLTEPFRKKKQPTKLQWMNPSGFKRRRSERGVLDQVEKLQSFLYPERLSENGIYKEDIPKFVEGGIVSSHQFRPPATLIFSYGRFLLKGVLLSAPVEYTLFDEDLTPIRANISVEFKVNETANLRL